MTEVYIAKQQDKLKLIEVLKATEMPYKVRVTKGKRRSLSQNSYLWGVCYETILNHGMREQGFTQDDIHEYMLGECYGWKTVELFGRKRLKPIRTTTKDIYGEREELTTTEFTDYIAFVQQRAAESGIVIEDPPDSA